MKIFSAQLKELNNHLPLFPGSSVSNKMAPEELNEIILHAIFNEWAKQAYLQDSSFKGRTCNDTCKMFYRMVIAEQFYECGKTYKNTNREEADPASHISKRKGG